MQQQVAKLPASVVAEQMQAFNRLTPEQKKFAAGQAARVDPATILSQANSLGQQAGSDVLTRGQQYKAEGNKLHSLQQFDAAAEKYKQAISCAEGWAIYYLSPCLFMPGLPWSKIALLNENANPATSVTSLCCFNPLEIGDETCSHRYISSVRILEISCLLEENFQRGYLCCYMHQAVAIAKWQEKL